MKMMLCSLRSAGWQESNEEALMQDVRSCISHRTAPAQSGFRGLDLRLGQLNAHKMFYASRGCFMRVEIK